MDIKKFHGEAAGLGDAVVETGITRFGAVAANDGVLGAMIEHALFEVFGEIMVDDEFAFDDALGSSVGALAWC